jgi:hypothetical protein
MRPSDDTERAIAVWIVGTDPLPDTLLRPILWGLEEEGIPADTRSPAAGTAAEMARLAADGSPLNVGIGVSGSERAVALHHRDLADAEPLFVLRAAELEPALLRRLGANAARLVKGNPLAVATEPATRTGSAAPAAVARDLVDEIAALVVARLLSERQWRSTSATGHARRRTE